MKKIRGFELISEDEYNKSTTDLPYSKLTLPKRATKQSAGYDIISTLDISLNPGESIKIPTGFKAYMQAGEMLAIYPRSSVGFKYTVRLANTVGIGDADYYNNISNEGHYFIKLVNEGDKVWQVKAGEAIAQGIFMPILLADGDDYNNGEIRVGGIGSTDK